jgi:hypothetical protein
MKLGEYPYAIHTTLIEFVEQISTTDSIDVIPWDIAILYATT